MYLAESQFTTGLISKFSLEVKGSSESRPQIIVIETALTNRNIFLQLNLLNNNECTEFGKNHTT